MLSHVPAFWRMAAGGFFLPAFLLALPHAVTAAKDPSPQIQELGTKKAAKLLIHVVKPHYPPVARVNYIRGNVKLKIKVTLKGRVSEAHVMEGEPILAAAALKSVRKWLYHPYVSNGKPVPFSTSVIVNFSLHSHFFRNRLPTDADEYLEKQVRPPEVISRPQQNQPVAGIRMKVLVGTRGEVVDSTSTKAGEMEIRLARKNLSFWKFRPARWGAIAVPWYVTVTVPLPYAAMDQVANSAKR